MVSSSTGTLRTGGYSEGFRSSGLGRVLGSTYVRVEMKTLLVGMGRVSRMYDVGFREGDARFGRPPD